MYIDTETLIFEARILAESTAMGLGRVKDPSEIAVVRRLLAELDAILVRALESTGEARGLEPGPTGECG